MVGQFISVLEELWVAHITNMYYPTLMEWKCWHGTFQMDESLFEILQTLRVRETSLRGVVYRCTVYKTYRDNIMHASILYG